MRAQSTVQYKNNNKQLKEQFKVMTVNIDIEQFNVRTAYVDSSKNSSMFGQFT